MTEKLVELFSYNLFLLNYTSIYIYIPPKGSMHTLLAKKYPRKTTMNL